MARLLRATLLLTTLGVAAPALPVSAAAANAGGAAPGTVVAMGVDNGGAEPGEAPRSTATSSSTGGALAGRKPARRVVKRQVTSRKRARRTPRRTAVPAPPVAPPVGGVFPLTGGIFDFGGEDARFGAGRPGHVHQGQDVIAPRGTPIVAPISGTITWKKFQRDGAGIYLVLRGTEDGRDYVFMHIKRGTVVVKVGDLVTAGQQLAQVGSTGASSGPHLHFEIWVGGWWEKGGAPIDPLPQLQAWAGLPAS